MPDTLISEYVGPQVRRLKPTLDGLLETPGRLRRDWDRMCQEVAEAGRVEELHAGRSEYQQIYDDYLEILEGFRDLVRATDPQLAVQLQHAADELRRLAAEVFTGWQSLDDLYRKLMDKLSLSHEDLRKLAARHPPPQSWYDDTDDPFTPVE